MGAGGGPGGAGFCPGVVLGAISHPTGFRKVAALCAPSSVAVEGRSHRARQPPAPRCSGVPPTPAPRRFGMAHLLVLAERGPPADRTPSSVHGGRRPGTSPQPANTPECGDCARAYPRPRLRSSAGVPFHTRTPRSSPNPRAPVRQGPPLPVRHALSFGLLVGARPRPATAQNALRPAMRRAYGFPRPKGARRQPATPDRPNPGGKRDPPNPIAHNQQVFFCFARKKRSTAPAFLYDLYFTCVVPTIHLCRALQSVRSGRRPIGRQIDQPSMFRRASSTHGPARFSLALAQRRCPSGKDPIVETLPVAWTLTWSQTFF